MGVDASEADASPLRPMSYLREHSVGSVLRSSMHMLLRHFGTLLLVLCVPLITLQLIFQSLMEARHYWLAGVFFLITIIVSLFAFAALIVVVADICLGRAPSTVRAYRRVFGPVAGKLFLTNIVQVLIIGLGMILLIVPGLVAFVWLLFSPSIVVLEGKLGRDALRRSKQLGDGFHWRNASVLALILVFAIVLGGIVGGIAGAIMGATGAGLWVVNLAALIVQYAIAVPLMYIALALLYYELRVRKESYDAAALAEALRR